MDDYFEEAAKLEAESKGAKPGDLVLEPAEPMGYASTTAADIYVKGAKESRTGIYKSGGPTTFFGSDGVGPFRGEMSSTKKAMLARENLTEENWMAAVAYSVWECNEELRKSREERIIPGGGVEEVRNSFAQGWDIAYAPAPIQEVKVEETAMDVDGDADGDDGVAKAAARRAAAMAASLLSPRPRGIYEVHTGQLHCEFCIFLLTHTYILAIDPENMQPTKYKWVPVPEDTHMHVIGGAAKVGSTAWGIAWVDYQMEEDVAARELEAAERLKELQEAEKSGIQPITL